MNKLIQTIKTQAKELLSKDKIKMVATESLKFDDDFKGLFSQEQEKVDRIAADMIKNGFDKSQPIIITAEKLILDGNSRFLAAQQVGIKTVPAIIKTFESKDEALMYELKLQLNRRNLTDAELHRAFLQLDAIKQKSKVSGDSEASLTDEKIAEQLNISPRQISKIRAVEREASPEILQKLDAGEITINQAHNEIKKTSMPLVKSKNQKPLPKLEVSEKESFRMGVKFAIHSLDIGKTRNEILTTMELPLNSKLLDKDILIIQYFLES